jgi:NADH-quinone oxidoreductase E subunit
MALELSPSAREKLRAIAARYPHKMAACLPALHLAQQEFGSTTPESCEAVARALDLPPAHVWSVATFYTMYNKRPVGKYHVQVCTNVGCMLRGGYDVLRRLEQVLGVRAGETTPDGKFTLDEVECLASCGTAVCIQVNEEYSENMDAPKAERLIGELRRG